MEIPKPTEAHKKLALFDGNWRGDEKIFPSPFDPKGGLAVGRVENRVSLDGFAVVQDYMQERTGGPGFKGHGVFTYDAQEKTYHMYWWDSWGMPLSDFKGNFEGNVLTVSCKGPMGLNRATFDFAKKGTYTFKLDVSPDGAQWHPFMEGTYKKT